MNVRHPGRTALLVGLGRTGVSCARHLARAGWSLAATDSRDVPPGRAEFQALAPTARLQCGRLDAAMLTGVQLVVASPGVALSEPILVAARERGIDVVGDIELFARAATAPLIGITGTNGKSTVTTLLGRMAERAGIRVKVGGNLGTPALDLLGDAGAQLYVLELSSFQLDTTHSLRLLAATVLNVTPDHLDRYASVADYAASKARIFARCGTAVINLDDPRVAAMASPQARRTGFSLVSETADYAVRPAGEGLWTLLRHGERLLDSAQMRLSGRHNLANALASVALGDAAGIPLPSMLAELREFSGLPHRSQWVADLRGVRYVNDSKGTNVGATLAAIAGMPGTLLLIAGGDGKGQDFAPLAAAIRGKVRHVLLIGRDAAAVARAIEGACSLELCADLVSAVQAAARHARAGETVLLSPACSSLDMFRDYSHRGDEFVSAVRRLN